MSDQRHQAWSRAILRDKRRSLCSISGLVREPPSPSALEDQIRAGFIIDVLLDPQTVRQDEFGHVAV